MSWNTVTQDDQDGVRLKNWQNDGLLSLSGPQIGLQTMKNQPRVREGRRENPGQGSNKVVSAVGTSEATNRHQASKSDPMPTSSLSVCNLHWSYFLLTFPDFLLNIFTSIYLFIYIYTHIEYSNFNVISVQTCFSGWPDLEPKLEKPYLYINEYLNISGTISWSDGFHWKNPNGRNEAFLDGRRKFRSQTSSNMDRWKAEVGRVREEKRRRKRKSQKKEDPGARKGRKVAKHCVFPMICGSGGSKSRLAKAAGAEPAGQMRDEKLHAVVAQVKMHKAPHARTTFGNWDVEKVHTIVARSTFPSQNIQSPPAPDHFWKLRCRKSARRCGAKHISKSKGEKHHMLGPLLDVQMSFRVAGARDCAPCQKWAKREGFVAFPKTMAGVGHLKRICKDAFSVAGAVQATSSSELLGGPGADFLRGVAFWSIRSSGLLRWFCVTGAALRMTWHHFFVAGAVV